MKDFMNSAWVILRREIVAQFSSPMAYIFVVVFLVMSTALFMFLPPFFAFPVADMTGFFGWVVPMLCIFAPAATMRIWAEEWKENTIELLLTFPISPPALVVGKFLAAMAFFLVAVASTIMMPIMLAALGEPDWGMISSGYLGMVLVGAFYLALGMFVSGFCKDQVTGFVLTFMACGAVTIFGWEPFVTILEGSLGWLGTFLSDALGMTAHYVPFTRGIVEVSDILYFVGWTALFLFLNGTYLEGRRRPKVMARFAGTVGLGLVVGILFNLVIVSGSLLRFDLTEGQIYTVSDATKRMLKALAVPVQVKVYITPGEKLPAELKNLERDIVDKLREMSVASRGRLQHKVIHMEAANVIRGPGAKEEEDEGKKDDKKKSLEERLIDKGVKPFSVRALRQDQATTQLIYSSIGVAYKEKEEEIIPRVLPQSLPELEYRLVSIAYKLTRKDPPTIALVAPFEEVKIPPYMMQMYMQMGKQPPQQDDPYEFVDKVLTHEKFEVRRVKLEKGNTLPDTYDALVVLSPRELDKRQKWEINRALAEGIPTFVAAQHYKWNYSVERNRISVSKVEEKPGINDILAPSGIRLDERILMDSNYDSLTISSGRNPLEQMLGMGITVDLPMHVVVNAGSMNQEMSITNRIGRLFYLWGSALKLDEEKIKENKLDVTTLFSTSEDAWLLPPAGQFSEKPPRKLSQYPLAVMVKGKFPFAFDEDDRPAWSDKPPSPGMPPPPPSDDDEGPAKPIKPSPDGKLIVVGCAQMFNKNFLGGGNMDFFMNCIDTLTLTEDLIHIRAKKPVSRAFDQPSSAARAIWKFLVLGLMALVVVALGIVRLVLVRRRRERYRASLRAAS